MKGPLFYSKILLFGEHGINKGSKGLSIPYNFYNGGLRVDDSETELAKKSNQSLRGFVTWLEQLQAEEPGLVTFDLATLKLNVEAGMYFDSSIPQGYGICSCLRPICQQ
jgi:mevalonate kinase